VDHVQRQGRPPEIDSAQAGACVRVEELADAAAREQRDGTSGELRRHVGIAMGAQTLPQVPVGIHPRRAAPRRLGPVFRVKAGLGGGDARYGIRQPELTLVQQMVLDQPTCDASVERPQSQRKQARERQGARAALIGSVQIPEDPSAAVPALVLERDADPPRALFELDGFGGRVPPPRGTGRQARPARRRRLC